MSRKDYNFSFDRNLLQEIPVSHKHKNLQKL
jgi:hypothetical protein